MILLVITSLDVPEIQCLVARNKLSVEGLFYFWKNVFLPNLYKFGKCNSLYDDSSTKYFFYIHERFSPLTNMACWEIQVQLYDPCTFLFEHIFSCKIALFGLHWYYNGEIVQHFRANKTPPRKNCQKNNLPIFFSKQGAPKGERGEEVLHLGIYPKILLSFFGPPPLHLQGSLGT